MIDKHEIDRKSEELGVHASNIQRDYVFGWLLAGLYQANNPLQRLLVLKGGNAFRKAYFENARFSNDLDFSTQIEIDQHLLLNSIKQACLFAMERSGVQILPDDSRIGEKHSVDEDSRLYEARVYFKSFYGEEDATLKVSLDIKEFDRIFLPIQSRNLIHSYSDRRECNAVLHCFKLEELLASKLRALLHRRHSPDLYDFVYSTFFQKVLDIKRREVVSTFLKKTIYEPDPQTARSLLLELPFKILQGFWDKYLVCPNLSLISFGEAETSFRSIIMDLFNLLAPSPTPVSLAGSRALSFYNTSYRDTIMDAGRLSRILHLVYKGYERLVEPYALVFKRKKDGVAREYLYVWNLSGGRSGREGIRSFFADEVQGVRLTDQTFKPRFPIELSKDGGYFGTESFSSKMRSSGKVESATSMSPRPRKSLSSPFGPPLKGAYSSQFTVTYTVQCPYCGKRFKRNKYDTTLNEHKDKYGNRCYGRIGYIV